ncbi:FMN reductase [Dactylosporangium matsuzakiense]|uniref:FMN reductase n=1 Tax=Dactylosporangium matsuzakiense TaxID=53360 RepID=A0A9W6KLV1_9ACTN|nr:FMN reductase [Dactylosporangium matsuzakiense]UWZ42650.1 FMN reductase [Dactylosporangium matsuzakiense]GLL03878.1 FMN reductase [Dactylosporangium matsuzakiense]
MIVAITAGLSQPSSTRLLADRLSAAVSAKLQAEVQTFELRDLAHDITDHLLTGFPSPRLKEVVDAVAGADALVAVSPIFNASYSGLFKSFFDVLGDDVLDGKPVLLGATGGTARHSLALEHALRPLFVYLHAVVAPTAVFAATDDWAAGGHNTLHERIARAAGELAALVQATGPTRAPKDPFALTTSFEDLLGRS